MRAIGDLESIPWSTSWTLTRFCPTPVSLSDFVRRAEIHSAATSTPSTVPRVGARTQLYTTSSDGFWPFVWGRQYQPQSCSSRVAPIVHSLIPC
jgi:hypothetical protein